MHCFGVGFFVEGEYEIMNRVKRSFLFEVEEDITDNEEEEDEDDKNIHSNIKFREQLKNLTNNGNFFLLII